MGWNISPHEGLTIAKIPGRPKGRKGVKNLKPPIIRQLADLKERLKHDAPDRYEEILIALGRLHNQMTNARYEPEFAVGEGGGKLEPNCTFAEAMNIKVQFLNYALRLVEHNTGKATESKEVKETKKLILEIKGFDPKMFRLPLGEPQDVVGVVEAEFKDAS